MYSDQPVMPSSVVIFRKELTRQPASQCKSSILVIFTEFSSREKYPPPHPGPLRPRGRRGSCGGTGFPSPPFRGRGRGPRQRRGRVTWANSSSAARDVGEDRFEIGQEQGRILAHREVTELFHDHDLGARYC